MITVELDIKAFQKGCDDAAKRQIPFATMKAINQTATDFQAAERTVISNNFTIRRSQFVLNTVKIERGNFATKDNLQAIIHIDPTRNELAKFEAGKPKLPTSGTSIAVPIAARRNKSDIITAANRPKALGLVNVPSKGGNIIARGLNRTFMIKRSDGTGGIFQRIGRGKGTLKELFAFKPRVPIPKSLHFQETAVKTVTAKFSANFKTAFEYAMKTARP